MVFDPLGIGNMVDDLFGGEFNAKDKQKAQVANQLPYAASGGGQSAAPTGGTGPTTGTPNLDTWGNFVANAQNKANAGPQPWISPLAVQAYFAKAIAPMLAQIQGHQDQAIKDFVGAAGAGNVDQRQLASMQNVNNALAGAAVAGPGLDMLMNQVNAALNAQQKAYFAAQSNQQATAGGGDLTAFLQSLFSGG